MIIGIGVDIVRVQRLERWNQTPALVERFFHEQEIADSRARGVGVGVGTGAPGALGAPGVVRSLAARFAAKEAFGKALGTGLAGIALKDIQVVNRPGGQPEIKAHGTARAALEKSGANRIHLSLSHEQDNAVAMVVLETSAREA